MADKADRGIVFSTFGSGQKSVDVAVFVHFDLLKSDTFEFVCKVFCKFELLVCTWATFAGFIRRGREAHVL